MSSTNSTSQLPSINNNSSPSSIFLPPPSLMQFPPGTFLQAANHPHQQAHVFLNPFGPPLLGIGLLGLPQPVGVVTSSAAAGAFHALTHATTASNSLHRVPANDAGVKLSPSDLSPTVDGRLVSMLAYSSPGIFSPAAAAGSIFSGFPSGAYPTSIGNSTVVVRDQHGNFMGFQVPAATAEGAAAPAFENRQPLPPQQQQQVLPRSAAFHPQPQHRAYNGREPPPMIRGIPLPPKNSSTMSTILPKPPLHAAGPVAVPSSLEASTSTTFRNLQPLYPTTTAPSLNFGGQPADLSKFKRMSSDMFSHDACATKQARIGDDMKHEPLDLRARGSPTNADSEINVGDDSPPLLKAEMPLLRSGVHSIDDVKIQQQATSSNASSDRSCESLPPIIDRIAAVPERGDVSTMEIDAHTLFMQEIARNSAEKPALLTHYIDGFVIQESTEPFPVSPFPFDDFVTEAMLELATPPELEPEVSANSDTEQSDTTRESSRQSGEQPPDSLLFAPASSSAQDGAVIVDSPPAVRMPASKNMMDWSVDDVCAFIVSLGHGIAEHASLFRQQEIDGQALHLLREEHLLVSAGLRLGPAIKICAAVKALRR